MKISFQLNEQDYFEYSYYTAWQAPWNNTKRIRYYLSITIIGFGLIALAVLTNKIKTFESNIIFASFIAVIYFPLSIIMTKNKFRNMARKVYHDLNNKKLFSKRDMSFNNEGIFGKDDFSEFQYKWSGMTKRHSTQNIYILFSSDIAAMIIPKRAFKTELEKESFEKMLAQYLPLQADLPTTSN